MDHNGIPGRGFRTRPDEAGTLRRTLHSCDTEGNPQGTRVPAQGRQAAQRYQRFVRFVSISAFKFVIRYRNSFVQKFPNAIRFLCLTI